MRNVPPVPALLAFESATRLRSIRRAAAELSLSHTVVSRHIRNLEALTGTKLLVTSAKGATPTAEGVRYHLAIAEALGRIAEATAELRPTVAHGEIRISCATGLAKCWLTRRLSDLERVLSPVEIVLTPTDRPPDFARREADVAISFGAIGDAELRSEVLANARMFPVASPAYVAAHGPLEDASSIARQTLIHEESKDQWRAWLAAAGVEAPPRLAGPRLRYADLTLEAALQGHGVALTNRLLAGAEIDSGRLVECGRSDIVLAPYVVQGPPNRWEDSVVRRLRSWLRHAVAVEIA